MAHSWRKGPQRLTALWAAAFALAAPEAGAIALGEPEVRSALGESLDVRIPVSIGSGESIEPACFTVAREPATDVPRLTGARVSLERSAFGTYLRIRSASAVNEPALMLGIIASCPGQVGEYKRDYSMLLDPRPATAAAPSADALAAATPAPGSTSISTVRAIATTLIARIGDTLESIANAIFPRNRVAKKSYIEALRESNPPLAALDERDPIPVDTPIALPDLRTFARSRPSRQTDVAAAPRPAAPAKRAPAEPKIAAAPREAAARREPAPPRERPIPATVPSERKAERIAAAPPPPRSERGKSAPGFVLKLSSGEVDLSRTRDMDDRGRAQLRDRQLVLDADDQVAAVLALRNSVRQLESKVAELQLKLAGMPASFPAPKATEPPKAAPAVVPPPKAAEPPKVTAAAPVVVPPPKATEAPKVTAAAPVVVPPPKVVEAPPAPAVAKAPVVTPPAPTPAPPIATAPVAPPASTSTPPAVAAPITPPVVAAPSPPSTPTAESKPVAPAVKAARPLGEAATESEWLTYALWGVVVLLIAAAGLLAWRLARRRKQDYEEEPVNFDVPPETAAPADDEIVVADEHPGEDAIFAEEPIYAPEPGEAAADGRRSIDSDVGLTTRLPGENTDDLRRRYIEERFPEITKGAIVLENPDSVVKGARLFYEDGAVARAVELLQFACERNPDEVKAWLALFEIFRLERLTGEFATLARRFKEHHGKSEYWRKVQFFGREIDPTNTLYQEDPINTFETIGPREAKRIAGIDTTFDPIAENWLGAPMDFENEVLAKDLRIAMMSQAGINETDLTPNPMPALRNVEMFTVA